MTKQVSVSPDPVSHHRLWRARWAAIGAAVAVAIGAGGIYVGHAADVPPTSSFVTIAPVRILDTRSNLGLSGPFTSLASRDLLLTGVIATIFGDDIVLPTGASAVSLNVTVVGPTASGFLSVRPANAAGAPTTSSLNFTAGEVIPNAVTVSLPRTGADTGKIEITYDAFGVAGPTTHVLIDVVGYYMPDDKATTLALSPASFTASNSGVVFSSGCARGASSTTIRGGVALPVGAIITGISAWVIDSGAGDDVISLTKTTAAFATIAIINTTGAAGIQRLSAPVPDSEFVQVGEYYAFEYTGADLSASHSLCGVEIDYISP